MINYTKNHRGVIFTLYGNRCTMLLTLVSRPVVASNGHC